jgi:hypothetical protein
MAEITNLTTLSKTSATDNDFLLVSNKNTKTSTKLSLTSVFPSFATSGAGSEDIWISITNKNQLNFKGIKSSDTGLLTVATTDNNIVLTALEAGIDLSLCNNLTSGFISGIDFSGTVTGENSPLNGGTGLSTIAKGAILYANAADTIAATAAPTNGQILMGNATLGYPVLNTLTAGTGMTILNEAGSITLTASLTTMAAELNMATFNVNLNTAAGASWISGAAGQDEGLTVDVDGKVFIGEAAPTAAFVSALNIKGSIEFTNNAAPTIKPTASTSTAVGQPLTIESGSSANGAAGNLNLTAGTASGTAAGGSVIVTGGQDTGATSDGSIQLKTYAGSTATAGLTVAGHTQDVTVDTGNLVITAAGKGIIHTGSGTVTQATNHGTDTAAINSTSGVITLAAVALAAGAEADFAVPNSTIQADSVILLTVQSPAAATATNNATLVAQLDEVNAGSMNIRLSNPGAAATAASASKIHFLVINNS